jgi:hypothetical protein
MNTVKRYMVYGDDDECMGRSEKGRWVEWPDIEKLQTELVDIKAKLLAALSLVPEDTTFGELQTIHTEAVELLRGSDKQTIARLQDEITNLREGLRRTKLPLLPGVHRIYARYPDAGNVDYELAVFALDRHSDGNLSVGVYLPWAPKK